MKCPNCDYAHGYEWVGDEYMEVDDGKGSFWVLPIKLEHDSLYTQKKEAGVHGCPSCKTVFFEEHLI